jgi:hypothetical protein
MRRHELEALGIHLPALATVALGALPGPPVWAERLVSLGLDVVASGAAEDTPGTWAAARAAVPFRPVKAVAGDAAALAAAGAAIIETAGAVPPGAYRIGPDEAVIAVVDGSSSAVEDPNAVARDIVDVARDGSPAHLWVVSTPGLHTLPVEVAEAKLRALAECAYRARLVFAKEQFSDED